MQRIKKDTKILVVGSANMDMVITAPHFPQPGETIAGYGFMPNHGGKGANQAVAAARLGAKVAFVGKVGNDQFGQAMKDMMCQEGIDVSALSVASQIPTGVALITTVPSGENTIVIEPGANAQLTPEDVEQAEELFEDAGIVLMQLETPVTTLIKAAELAKQHGAYVVLNPAPAPVTPLPDALLQHVDLLIPNETEAAAISGTEVVTTDDVPGAMERLHSMGIKNVIITLGSKGAYASVEGSIMKVEAEKVEAVDTTAAGDTFCGAVCVALSEGRSITEAVEFANRAAAITVTRMGAPSSLPSRREVES